MIGHTDYQFCNEFEGSQDADYTMRPGDSADCGKIQIQPVKNDAGEYEDGECIILCPEHFNYNMESALNLNAERSIEFEEQYRKMGGPEEKSLDDYLSDRDFYHGYGV